jgi:phage gp36-like protein
MNSLLTEILNWGIHFRKRNCWLIVVYLVLARSLIYDTERQQHQLRDCVQDILLPFVNNMAKNLTVISAPIVVNCCCTIVFFMFVWS